MDRSKIADGFEHWQGQLRVAEVASESPTVKKFQLVCPDGSDLPFTYKAGQFLTLDVTVGGKRLKRAYTMTSHPCDKKTLEITIKRQEEGVVSCYMCDSVRPGDLLDVQASFGKLTFSPTEASVLVLIGGGVGITPLISVLRCLLHCGCVRWPRLFRPIFRS